MDDTRRQDVLFFPRVIQDAVLGSAETKLRLAVIGNYPPRRCGIASFTADMVGAISAAMPAAEIDVYAMAADAGQRFDLPVCAAIVADEPGSYRKAAASIEASQADVVWLQHEFGLFGGPAGDLIMETLGRISAPLVVTLHTILEAPDADQRRVMDWLIARAARLVVMSHHSQTTLEICYNVSREKIALIHHGVPDRPFGRSVEMKQKRGHAGRKVMLTFGLLSPGKGIETAIAALPELVQQHGDVIYCIAGATHPNLVAREGEAYRLRLQELARELGVEQHVRWIDSFLETEDLLDLIESADIYLTPYGGAGQSTSGTLSYAVALGKAVISTPYIHARELLADGSGVLIPFGDSGALSAAAGRLFADPDALQAMQRRAYLRGREMLWPGFAAKSLAVVDAVRVPPIPAVRHGAMSDAGLMRLCDDTGMIQHSVLSVPDRSHGYCVDDNARALILSGRSGVTFAKRAPTFAAFIEHAWNPDARRFRNFMGYDRRWLEAVGSEDSCGRVIWALGSASLEADKDLRAWADHLYRKAASMALEFTSPRALAFAMLGADRHLEAHPGDALSEQILRKGVKRMTTQWAAASRAEWRWFETSLAYDNCRLPEALLRAAARFTDGQTVAVALEALGWIMEQQTAPAGHFRPLGSQGFGNADLPHHPFDQQPVDAWATVDAAACAFELTLDPRWLDAARAAYAWFNGANDRAQPLADPQAGTCCDGLAAYGVNRNHGAESVLAYHLAHARIIALEDFAGEGHDKAIRERDPIPV